MPSAVPYGEMANSRAARAGPLRPEPAFKSQVRGSARVSGWLELAATDEKDLSTAQSPTQTDPRLPGPDGHPRRAQRAQAAAQQGPQTPRNRDSAETARLTSRSAPERPYGFGPASRLHRRSEFLRVQRQGARYQTAHFAAYAARFPELQTTRLGVTVSRRIGNAVVRNRIKRRVRECFRLTLRPMLPLGAALVVIARTGAGQLDSSAITGELVEAAANLGRRLGSSK